MFGMVKNNNNNKTIKKKRKERNRVQKLEVHILARNLLK